MYYSRPTISSLSKNLSSSWFSNKLPKDPSPIPQHINHQGKGKYHNPNLKSSAQQKQLKTETPKNLKTVASNKEQQKTRSTA